MTFNVIRSVPGGDDVFVKAFEADAIECHGDTVAFKRNVFTSDAVSSYGSLGVPCGQTVVAVLRLQPGESVVRP